MTTLYNRDCGGPVATRDLQLGDVVSLNFADKRWDCAKVTKITDTMVTFFRPWMAATDDGYPTISVEIFEVYRDSDKTVTLIDRVRR